jgi:hypothetical protein
MEGLVDTEPVFPFEDAIQTCNSKNASNMARTNLCLTVEVAASGSGIGGRLRMAR